MCYGVIIVISIWIVAMIFGVWAIERRLKWMKNRRSKHGKEDSISDFSS